MRHVYEKAGQVIAWLGPLAGGEIAFNAVHTFFEEYCRRNGHYTATLLRHEPRTESILQDISDEYMKELELADQTSDNEYLTKAKALGLFFHSDFWARAWIWQELIVARSIQLYWNTKSMDSAPFCIAARVLYTTGISRLYNQMPKSANHIFIPTVSGSTLPTVGRSAIYPISIVDSLRGIWHPEYYINIKYLLRKIRRAQSSDLRDRVYAICGLISPDYQIIPDYTSTLDSVYCRTAWSIISCDRSLDIIAFCGGPLRESTVVLPSWCPDCT